MKPQIPQIPSESGRIHKGHVSQAIELECTAVMVWRVLYVNVPHYEKILSVPDGCIQPWTEFNS